MMRFIPVALMAVVVASCAGPKRTVGTVEKFFVNDSTFLNAHTGVSVYDPESRTFIAGYQDDKYFIPASNTKIFSCYAAMKALGDSLPGIFVVDTDTAAILIPTGDPTLLHKDYVSQPVADLIRGIRKPIYLDTSAWNDDALGSGWSWGDYSEYYMVERSALPVYGNVVRWYQVKTRKENPTSPADTIDTFIYSDPELDGPVNFGKPEGSFRVERDLRSNAFTIIEGREKQADTDVPFITYGNTTGLALLEDTLHKLIRVREGGPSISLEGRRPVYSRHLDSMLVPMMHRSDNFFAEQSLLLAGRALTGRLNTRSAVESVKQQYFAGIPHTPRWADGSGLSRYNLFTPRDMVWVLEKMKSEFSWERLKAIFPTGGKGTLRSYVADSGRLYAKTGTLQGVLALSGYIVTKKNKVLIFSIMINNHQQPTAVLRNKMAAFLRELIDKY